MKTFAFATYCKHIAFATFSLIGLLSIELSVAQNVTISTSQTSPVILNANSLLTITNTGSLTVSGNAISSSNLTGASILNNGIISGDLRGIFNYSTSTITAVTNNNTMSAGNFDAIENQGTINSIVNSGQLNGGSGNSRGIHNDNFATIGSIINTSTGAITSGGYDGILNAGVQIDLIQNSGSISGGVLAGNGVRNDTTLLVLTNLEGGTITGGLGGNGVRNLNSSSIIQTLTNYGTITGGSGGYGIQNAGTITTLNNAQGAGNTAGALTYTGNLPTNYNIIINSPTSFGQLAVTTGTGSTTFGVSSLSAGKSIVSAAPYTTVLTGITPTQLGISGTSKSGVSNNYSYTLNETGIGTNIWDLIISGYVESVVVPIGPSVANTNQSLVNTASALQGTYTLQNSVLANSFSYDCTVFGANDICVSAGGRNTQVQAANGLNNTSALLIAAYRPHPNYRIGTYADQNLSVSNPGGTVNLGNNTPLIGLFAAWNERLDGTGTEVKVSAAYGQKNTTITRSVVGSGSGASEAGSGSSTLNSQGTQLTAKYGFGVIEDLIVSPYVGVRYTQNNMAGYTEGTSSTVTAPLTYSALNTNATTALAGIGASYRVIPQVMTFASAGVETDTNTANGTYSATNPSIGTLTPVNFNANPVRTRPTATVGAYYDVEKNQRLGITGIYRQEPYQAVSTTTVMATYTIGL